MASCRRRRPKTSRLSRGCWLSRCEMARRAVVLFNLGGPDSPAAVRPFLRNLFSDPAIIRTPGWPRWLVAELTSRVREGMARANYAHMGGASPLNAETQAQADALGRELARRRPA